MFTQYNDDDSSSQSTRGGDDSSGTRTPTKRDDVLRREGASSSSSSSSLASSLQASHLLASGFDTASPASSSSSSTPSSYTIDSLATARNYLIENQEQLYNANTARRTSLPNTQRAHSNLLNLPTSLTSSKYPRTLLYQTPHRAGDMHQDRSGQSTQSQLRGVQPPQGGFQCPNCSKIFARDDLLRRHLTREARAQAQPTVDRQKSCYECARSKSRCDLEVPACGRCKARGKPCVYGARSGNPNMRRSLRDTQEPSGDGPSRWRESSAFAATSQWAESPDYPVGEDRLSVDESESDDSRQWVDPFQQYRVERATSTSSASTSASYDPSQAQQLQASSYDSTYAQAYHPNNRSGSPVHYNGINVSQSDPSAAPSQLPRTFSGPTVRSTIDTNVTSSTVNEEGEATPINRTNAVSLLGGAHAMGPPHITPGRHRETGAPFGQSYWDSSALGSVARASDTTQRPQPPRLLTGAKMPQPPTRPGVDPMSARPLFSAQLDLSGWLEEPVIPSPLYRMGPSLSALAPPTPTRNNMLASPSAWTGGGGTAEALRSALSANHMPLPVVDTVMAQQHNSNTDNKTSSAETHVAARQWWAHASDMPQNDVQIQGVAQACAGHFTVYPALMVLPEATSPVPPLFHRPWLASSRLHTPASLARARVLLAGYHVKLPSSDAMVWDMIANEVNALVASFDQHLNASDLDVFSSTAALWFLVILLLMSKDPTSGANVSDALVDSSLIGLSRFARLLAQRINACEERKRAQGYSPTFLEWGFQETMKRTLFASYALLVLQRFRETSTVVQSQLAGIDLILIVPLPAPAMEFEAGNELEWRAAQAVQITEPSVDGSFHPITIRHLLNARKGDHNTKEINQYFDRHDDFTNVCLSVAFALDREIS